MSETLYDGFDKLGKKQNKEQVPPAGEPHNKKKPSSNKASKTSSTSNTVTRETHKNLAEAFKAVSKAGFSPLLPLLLANFILFIKSSGCLSQRIPFDDDCLYNGLWRRPCWRDINEAVDGGIFKPVTCWLLCTSQPCCLWTPVFSLASSHSWMLGTSSSSWLTVKPCFQRTPRCGSKTWQGT